MMKTPILPILSATIAVLIADPASANPRWTDEATVRDTVQYRDLDLRSSKDRTRLERRISFAAYRLCLEVTGASPAPPPTDPACFIRTMKDALAQMDRAIARANGRVIVGGTGSHDLSALNDLP